MTLSSREKVLAGVVAGAVFIVFNLVLFKSFATKQTNLRQQISARGGELKAMQTLLAERDLWQKRGAWLAEKQPKLANENSAGVQLLEHVQSVAKEHGVTVEHPALGSPGKTQWYRSVTVNFETKSPWPALIELLQTLQQPEQFIVFESANISIDVSDESQLRGKFRIARWYAP